MSGDDKSVAGSCPPPKKEDVLFGPGEEWEVNASVGPLEADWVYTCGFRRAAQHLTKQMSDADAEHDMLLYPIVYLYRHHVELALKAIITTAYRLLDRELLPNDLKTLGRHNLADLWQVARPLLNPVHALADSGSFSELELEGIDSYIRQIHEHDPDGQRFRYATMKAKGPADTGVLQSLAPHLKFVNIGRFAYAMERMADYLECIESWFGDLEDAKIEWKLKYGSRS